MFEAYLETLSNWYKWRKSFVPEAEALYWAIVDEFGYLADACGETFTDFLLNEAMHN